MSEYPSDPNPLWQERCRPVNPAIIVYI